MTPQELKKKKDSAENKFEINFMNLINEPWEVLQIVDTES